MATVAQQSHPPTAGRSLRNLRWIEGPFWLVVLAGLIVFPLIFSDGSSTSVAFFTLVFAAAGAAWNIFSGYTGYIALGHAAFFGVGAYTLAIVCSSWHVPGGYTPFELVPLAGLVAAIVAVPIGFIALRTRRHTFIVITIAFLFIFQLLAENNLFGLTKGYTGLEYPIPPWFGASYNIPFYYVMVAILVLTVAVSWLVRHSKYGLELLAIRDDEDRALGLGVRTTMLKLSAFALSAFFVGMCGAVWGYFIESIYPSSGFNAQFDVVIALMAFLGGLGTISGPLLGALILIPAQQYLAVDFGESGWYLILYGAVFVAVILLLPQGIVPAISQLIQNIRGARSGAQLAAGPPQTGGAPDTEQRTENTAVVERR